jgi:hypothetical protein
MEKFFSDWWETFFEAKTSREKPGASSFEEKLCAIHLKELK